MMRMKDEYFEPVETDIRRYFHEVFWADILALLRDPYYRLNARDPVLDAIRRGTIQYRGGVFYGEFNITTSRELSKYATFDARSGTWKGSPPSAIQAAATIANSKAQELNQKIQELTVKMEERVAETIETLSYSIDAPLFAMNQQATRDLVSLGIDLEITPSLSQALVDEYTTNQDLNIVNWTPQQVESLREMVERNALQGYNRANLERMIATEYETTMKKAKFLARQETSLFMTTVRDTRYKDAGLSLAKWSTSNDARVVGNPSGLYPTPSAGHGNHWVLQGKICSLTDPTIYAENEEDARNGRWKSKAAIGAGSEHAGREFGCRCTYIPIL